VRRLQTRPQFQTVLAGPVIAKSPHFALHARDWESDPGAAFARVPLSGEPLIGALLPKRWAKRAVTRNAIKRQVFAVADQFQSQLARFAYVVRLRCAFDRTDFPSASSVALKTTLRLELSQLFATAVTRLPAARHA